MKNKLIIIFEIIFIISAMAYYVVKELIPEYKRQFGSSDKIVNSEKCINIIEVKINNNIDYMYLINKEEKIYHLIFFTPESIVLYNQNIENKNFDDGIEDSIKILIENNYLKKDSNITLTRYNNDYYNDFNNSLKKQLMNFNINTNILEEESDFIDKTTKLGLSNKTKSIMILEMDYYSKELIDDNNNKNKESVLNKTTSKQYASKIYKKLEKYINSNNINNLDINSTNLHINTIPADENYKYYPTSNSWYYVENKRVFSYIEFKEGNNRYGYCYKGSIDSILEGECDVNEKN